MNPVDVALAIHNRGWSVFPCRAADEVDESTGEIYSAKSPLTPNGLRGATKLERLVRDLWGRHPGAMTGLPTGRENGVWVLDVDRKVMDDGTVIDGFDTLAEYTAAHGDLPSTACVTTPRGGRHYYFRHVEGIRNRGGLGQGIDVRGEGGYVVAAGSVMADGRAYEWDPDIEPADAPQWLIDIILPAKYEPAPYIHHQGTNTAYVESALAAELSALASVPQGGRGEALNRAAFSLGTLVGAGALSRTDAENGLLAAAQANGGLAKDGERETRAKIKRGLESGGRQPRQIPESDYRQDNTPVPDFSRLIERAKRVAADPVNAAFEEIAAEVAESLPTKSATPEPAQEASPAKPLAIHATPFTWQDPRDLPRREFVYGTHLIRKYVSVTVSPGGVGKTSLTIAESLAMITGRTLLGTKPVYPLRVWLFNAEDPRDEMDRRVMGAAVHYNLQPKDIDGRLFLDTGREQELMIAVDNKNGVVVNVPVVKAVVDQIRANKIDVMIVDPFVSTHGVSENDNGAIDKVAKTWARIADETNCAIELVHHVKKVDGREINIDDSRGAVALLSAARSVRVLNRMTQEQGAKAGITEGWASYFCVTRGKANMSPNVGDGEWRKLENVGLGNGRGLQAPQDHVGVVVEFKLPGAEEILDDLPADTLQNVRNVIDSGSYRESVQAADWAGHAVARVLALDMDNGSDKARVKDLLRIWKEAGEFVRLDMKDAKGVDRPYLKSAAWAANNAERALNGACAHAALVAALEACRDHIIGVTGARKGSDSEEMVQDANAALKLARGEA